MAVPDIYGDLRADLPPTPAPVAPARRSEPPSPQLKPFRARNLVWKAPVEDVKETPKPAKSQVSTEVIDLEVEELQVLNTNTFTTPVPSSPSAKTSDGPTAPHAAEGALDLSTSAETADASGSAEPMARHALSDRSRGRNLVSKAVAEKSQSQDSNELKVLNSSCNTSTDGLDIYGDLCLDLPRTSSQGLADTPPRRRARNLVWKAENPTRPKSTKSEPSAVLDETAGMVDTPPLQTQQQEAALQKVLADEARSPAKNGARAAKTHFI